MKHIGFLINPIAGMGGRVGLKGTDGVVEEARALGAQPIAPQRAAEALHELARLLSCDAPIPIRWLTCSGIMGEEALRSAGFSKEDIEIVHTMSGEPTAYDTKGAVRHFLMRDVELIFFVVVTERREIYAVSSVSKCRFWAFRRASKCTRVFLGRIPCEPQKSFLLFCRAS